MYAATALQMNSAPDFSGIYDEHYRRVFNLCRYLLRSEEAAEDAAHDVFVKVRSRLDTYDPAHPFRNWLLKIASNHCLDQLRRRGRECRLSESDSLQPQAGGPGPLSQLLTEERSERVRRALDGLPEKYRLPLVLTYYNDFSYEEVGDVLGVGRNTVATLIYRAKQRLRTELLKREGPAS